LNLSALGILAVGTTECINVRRVFTVGASIASRSATLQGPLQPWLRLAQRPLGFWGPLQGPIHPDTLLKCDSRLLFKRENSLFSRVGNSQEINGYISSLGILAGPVDDVFSLFNREIAAERGSLKTVASAILLRALQDLHGPYKRSRMRIRMRNSNSREYFVAAVDECRSNV
jgi:hypothetical protein